MRLSVYLFIMLVVVLAISCRQTTPSAPESGSVEVLPGAEVAWFPLKGGGPAGGVSPCFGGLPMVVRAGRLQVAGSSRPFLEREVPDIVDFACGRHDTAYLIDGTGKLHTALVMGDPWVHLADLGEGSHRLGGADHQGVWIWTPRARVTSVRRWEAGELSPPLQVEGEVVASAPGGAGDLIVATSHDVFLIREEGEAGLLFTSELEIDGVAVDEAGRLLVSTERGVVRRERHGGLTVLSRGLHGALATGPLGIYVLSDPHAAVATLGLREGS